HCIEPLNFAFISTNGVPSGPANPQEANYKTFTPNSTTLLMNPGDQISVHMFDAQVPGARRGAKAFEVVLNDLTTGQSGFMQASAANGFQNTNMSDCSGTPDRGSPTRTGRNATGPMRTPRRAATEGTRWRSTTRRASPR